MPGLVPRVYPLVFIYPVLLCRAIDVARDFHLFKLLIRDSHHLSVPVSAGCLMEKLNEQKMRVQFSYG